MPRQQILPTWLAWNNCNFPTASGLQDLRTGQDFPAGGLNLGDYFEATEKEANDASAASVGLLHSGQYRLVQVDSAATVANVKTGTIGYLRAGTTVQNAVITTAGTGGTPGTYNVPANPSSGGGSGAVLTVVVGSNGALVSVSVLSGGFNYISVPSFSLALAALTGGNGAVTAQLNSSPNLVTSADQGSPQAGRQVVFLNSITPGNYGFIQEQGIASVLAGGAITIAHFVNSSTTAGTVSDGTTTFIPTTVGTSLEAGSTGNLFKIVMTTPVVQD